MVFDLVVKTADVKKVLKVTEVAKLLGISRDAVYKWPVDVPEKQAMKLIASNPTIKHEYVERKIEK